MLVLLVEMQSLLLFLLLEQDKAVVAVQVWHHLFLAHKCFMLAAALVELIRLAQVLGDKLAQAPLEQAVVVLVERELQDRLVLQTQAVAEVVLAIPTQTHLLAAQAALAS